MDVIDLVVEASIKADSERNEKRIWGWGRQTIYGLLASAAFTSIWCTYQTATDLCWELMVMSWSYAGLMAVLTAWFVVDRYIYRHALKRSEKPYEHMLFIPKDVAETKAGGDCSCEIEAWERKVISYGRNNFVSKSALRRTPRGYRFFFKEFEDYALFKLWV